MRSVFHTLNENKGVPFRTKPIVAAINRDGSLHKRLAFVAAVIKSHFILEKGWRFRLCDGSLTFQNIFQPHRALKVFIDLGNALAEKAGLILHNNPVVVGIELSAEMPFIRERIRDYCAATFGDYYLDPRRPRTDSLAVVSNSKYWIVPHDDHFYDIIFIPVKGCALPADPALIKKYEWRIGSCAKTVPDGC